VSTQGFEEAETLARLSDVAIVVLGSSPLLEGEEGGLCGLLSDGDRKTLDLPGRQEELLRKIHATGTPVVLVLVNGSALAVNWADANVPALLEAWYPGQAGGRAVAEALFGDYTPGGRLPVTFYKGLDQLPAFEDYGMSSHTCRYFRGQPLYPFGYGLSYTRFRYSGLKLSASELRAGRSLRVSVEVENTGDRAGDEVVQLYLTDVESQCPTAIRQLKGFQRVSLKPGQKKTVRFTVAPPDMSVVDDEGSHWLEPGEFRISVGGGQPGSRGTQEGMTVLSTGFTLTGKKMQIKPA
jgi:beta-glucosidase